MLMKVESGSATSFRRGHRLARGLLLALLLLSSTAQASIFKGEALDAIADVLTWIVLVIAPVIAIGVFLIIHILPEKIAEKKNHPQVQAIQTLCLLSLVFGGMLWPLAWLWAYTKPVFHKIAYGTDVGEVEALATEVEAEAAELERLRTRVAELEGRLAAGAPDAHA
jgi:CBS domain containing-hemolysin-like protein